MKNKFTKYGMLIIAAMLLICVGFVGAGSAATPIINTDEELKQFFKTGGGCYPWKGFHWVVYYQFSDCSLSRFGRS